MVQRQSRRREKGGRCSAGRRRLANERSVAQAWPKFGSVLISIFRQFRSLHSRVWHEICQRYFPSKNPICLPAISETLRGIICVSITPLAFFTVLPDMNPNFCLCGGISKVHVNDELIVTSMLPDKTSVFVERCKGSPVSNCGIEITKHPISLNNRAGFPIPESFIKSSGIWFWWNSMLYSRSVRPFSILPSILTIRKSEPSADRLNISLEPVEFVPIKNAIPPYHVFVN